MSHLVRAALLLSAIGVAAPVSAQVAISGGVSAEIRTFPQSPGLAQQDVASAQPAFMGEIKFEVSGLPKSLTLTFDPYFRYDSADHGRSIFDVHELKVAGGGQRWRIKAGYDVEFWGVMEVVNPVNIINQTDATEDFLGKRKLGQPMVDYTLLGKFGTIDFYALTGFQPLRFPRPTGRLRPAFPIDQDAAVYSSGSGRAQPEGAVRFFRNIHNVYLGLSQFYGYAREPEMLVRVDDRAMVSLVPSYALEHQTGLELQVTFGNMILKSEGVLRRQASGNRSSEAVSIGGEYDIGAVLHTGPTINLFGEYYYDSRDRSLLIPFRNDLFAGVRVGVNDRRSIEMRVWGNYDLTARKATVIMLDASARVSERVKAVVAYRGIVTSQSAFSSITHDSHVVVKLEAFF